MPPRFFLPLLSLAFFLALVGCTQPGAVPGSRVSIVRIEPPWSAEFRRGAPLNVTVAYANPGGRPVLIFVRPGHNGNITGGYVAHPSPRHTAPAGEVEGWFRFDGESEIDEVIVEMRDAETRNVLAVAGRHQRAIWRQ